MHPRRVRKFAPKVKTGCHTCRIRRVKCDEQRPTCHRCSSTGRKCDGYDNYCLTDSLLDKPVTQISGDIEERRLFHLFRTLTSTQFFGGFESRFWSRFVLQACHLNSSLRHAAIALGSLYEEFIGQKIPEAQRHIHNGGNYALRQYIKAIQETRKFMEDNDQPVIVTLMSCILFFCYESLRGQLAPAVIHLRSGLNILRLFYLENQESSTVNKSAIYGDIFNMYARLSFQANFFIDKTHDINYMQVMHQLPSFGTHQLNRISTLEEAQATLYNCLNGTMFSGHAEDPVVDINSFGSKYHMTRCAQLIAFGGRSAEFVEGREKAITALEKWHTSFKRFLLAQEGTMNSKDINEATLLQLHHLVAFVMLTTTCGSPKEKNDLESTMTGFRQIIEWSKFLLSEDRSINSATKPVLSPDVGIIAPLFFVATNCPDRALKAEAKEILANRPRREGIWDAEVVVKIIEDIDM